MLPYRDSNRLIAWLSSFFGVTDYCDCASPVNNDYWLPLILSLRRKYCYFWLLRYARASMFLSFLICERDLVPTPWVTILSVGKDLPKSLQSLTLYFFSLLESASIAYSSFFANSSLFLSFWRSFRYILLRKASSYSGFLRSIDLASAC